MYVQKSQEGEPFQLAYSCPDIKVLSLRKDRKGWVWWYMPVIPATEEAEVGRLMFQASSGKGARPYFQKGLGS
jgi:hypothetical protein